MTKAIHVLHIVRAMDTGGLEQVVADLLRKLPEHKVQSHLACISHPGSHYDNFTDIPCWHGNGNVNKRFIDMATARSLWRFAKDCNIDILHSHNPEPHRYGAMISMLARLPLVHTKHGRNFPDQPKAVWLNRQLSRLTKVQVAVSKDVADVAEHIEKASSKKLRIILNGVDTERYQPANAKRKAALRKEKALAENDFIIGTVGRLAPEKNVSLLIDAFADFYKASGRGSLVIVGAGPEEKPLKAQAAERGCPIIFTGEQDNIHNWLPCFDCFALSSMTEGTSITLLEAGACGLPALVSSVGGNPEIVTHKETGFVFPSENKEAMVEFLLACFQDETRRKEMGDAARKRIENNYALSKTVSAYADLYKEVLNDQ